MGDIGILIIGVVDTFFAFFVVAPMMLQAASLFGVQKQFAKAMVEEGVVTQEAVDLLRKFPAKDDFLEELLKSLVYREK